MKFKLKKIYFTKAYFTERTKLFSLSSMILNLFYGLIKAILSIIQFSLFLGVNAGYNIILGFAKMNALREHKKADKIQVIEKRNAIEQKCSVMLSKFAFSMSILYLVFNIVALFIKDMANYELLMILYIAACSFGKLTVSIISSIKTRKEYSLIIHYIKLLNLADACVAIGLTQRAILFMADVPNANYYSGIGGILFSIIALCVAIFMIRKSKTIKLSVI